MNLRCPVCRADNTTGPACRRCKANLSLLIAVEERRAFHLAQAQVAIRNGEFDDALIELANAEQLRAGTDIRQLRACLYLLAGDQSAALAEHSAATRKPDA